MKLRNSLLEELSSLTNLVVGSFFEREVQGITRHCLSRMVERKQRQVYVAPKDVEAVEHGVRQYKRAMEILRELGETNLKLIKTGAGLEDAR